MWHNFPIFAQALLFLSDVESIGISSHYDAPQCRALSHELSDWDESMEDIEKSTLIPQNGFFKGIFQVSSVPSDSKQMKLMKLKFGQWWNSYICLKLSPLSSTWQFFSFGGRTRQVFF